MRHAGYEILARDGSYLGRIEGLGGVWSNESTLEERRLKLQSVLVPNLRPLEMV
jgi:hypothetical protein